MAGSFLGFGIMLFSIPVLLGQWVGILGLGKMARNAAWWCMLAGISATTLGTLGHTLFAVLMAFNAFSPMGGISNQLIPIYVSSGLSGLGSLLFAIGFAIHGQQASRARQRITELEAIAAAQSEELGHQRPTY